MNEPPNGSDSGDSTTKGPSRSILHTDHSIDELLQFSDVDITTLLPGLLANPGDGFFSWVVAHLVESLQIGTAFVGEITGADYDHIETIEVYSGNDKAENFTYELRDTPCQEIMSGVQFYCPHSVAQQFPEDELLIEMDVQAYFGVTLCDETGVPLGIAVLLNNSPMSEDAARAAAALLRLLQPRIETEFRYRRAMAMMEVIASSALSTSGTIQQLVTRLANVTHMKCAYVALHEQSGSSRRVEPIVTVVHGRPYIGNVCASPCPCEKVDIGKVVQISADIQKDYPSKFFAEINAQAYFAVAIPNIEGTVLGHVGLVHDRPVHTDIFSLPLFRVIVARLGAELCQRVAQKRHLVLERRLAKRQHHEGLGVLAGGVAHDFNNLLVAIGGPAEIIRLNSGNDTEVNRHVETIVEATQQAAELCRQLLRYAGHKPANRGLFDLNELLSQSQRIANMYTSKNSVVDYHLASCSLPVHGSEIELQQAIMNLVKNAADATAEGGQIRIETDVKMRPSDSFANAIVGKKLKTGDYAVIRILDNGSGMSGKDLSRAFERFFTTKNSGTGIGLSVVISSIEEHGGALEVESTLGVGTEFTISLPLHGTAVAKVNKNRGTTSSKQEITALIIDDDPLVSKVLKSMLGHIGLRSRLASDGHQGLELFEKHHRTITVVLLDFTMPVMRGDKVLVELRKIDRTTPVILVSGNANTDTIGHFPEPPDAFLRKPFTNKELVDVLIEHDIITPDEGIVTTY